jgi:hypothetical protein
MGAVVGTEVPDFEVRYAVTPEESRAALHVEDDVFREMEFVPVGELYEPYLPQSALFGAFTIEGGCLGVMRLVDGGALLPPMFAPSHHVDITVDPARWVSLAERGMLEEVATLAVPRRYRGSSVLLDLIRFGCRHASGILDDATPRELTHSHMSAILAPGVAWGLRLRYYIPWQQVGPEQHYMEGTEYREDIVTAPYVLDLRYFEDEVLARQPAFREWFLYGPMSDHHAPGLPRLHRDDPAFAGCVYPPRMAS